MDVGAERDSEGGVTFGVAGFQLAAIVGALTTSGAVSGQAIQGADRGRRRRRGLGHPAHGGHGDRLPQGVPEVARELIALGRLERDCFGEHGLDRVADCGPERSRRGAARRIARRHRELDEVVALERLAPGDGLHHDERQREDVGPRAGGAVRARELLRRAVGGREARDLAARLGERAGHLLRVGSRARRCRSRAASPWRRREARR